MIVHNMAADFRLHRLYAFSGMPRARYCAERAVSIDSKGLACLLNDVGSGYAIAATSLYNIGAAPGMPRAVAYSMPVEAHFFERGEGWHKVDFLAMPVRFREGSTPSAWQLFEHSDDGWAAAGMVHFEKSGQGFFVPAGQPIDFTSSESLSASIHEGHLLPRHIGVREMVETDVIPEIQALSVAVGRDTLVKRERMAV